MNWCLRYEAIGQRKSENSGHKGSTAKEEEVPVETAWLLQWKLSCLCTDTADVLCDSVSTWRSLKRTNLLWVMTYMIIVEEEHEKETERKGYKHPFDIQMPEVN